MGYVRVGEGADTNAEMNAAVHEISPGLPPYRTDGTVSTLDPSAWHKKVSRRLACSVFSPKMVSIASPYALIKYSTEAARVLFNG